ncbi:MAG: hypothetical protein AAEJ52_11945 [Myxococcota bacterium]
MQRNIEIGLIGICGLACMTILLKNLSYPLMWQDESETALFATRILDHGFPKVHGSRNVVYEFGSSATLGIDERTDAYIGTTWGHFYFAVPGVLAAAATDDLYAKTWRIRLPFALAGALGIGLTALAVTPVFRGRPARARRFVIYFLLLCCASISLLLHLREARYYSLLVLLFAAIGWVQLRYVVFETLSYRRYAIALAVLMVLLFNVFYSAFFIVGLLLGVEALWRELSANTTRTRAGSDASGTLIRRIAMSLAPLAAAGICVVPLLVYFETFSIAAEFSKHVGFTVAVYLSNWKNLVLHLLRHELLAVVVLCRVAVLSIDRIWVEPLDCWEKRSRRVVAQLVGFALGYSLLSCLNPLVYERYFIVLSPLLTVVFVLDAMCVSARVKAHDRSRNGRFYTIAVATIVVLTAVTGVSRIQDLRGRLREITEPYRGPLDYVIPWIRAHYPHPEELVIATNYENHPYMYYLGSHTIVGLSRNNIRRDRLLEPDLVVPRRRWRSSLGDAMAFVRDHPGEYRSEVFEVRDLHYNNVPALSRSISTPDPHRFVTALADRDDHRLEVYVRLDSETAR